MKALLVVSFGTSYPETREKTIGAIERSLFAAFPDRRPYRAWTSRLIVEKMLRTNGENIDLPSEAMVRMISDGITDVLIQPTCFINGTEFDMLKEDIIPYRERFSRLSLGRPLIVSRKDAFAVLNIIREEFSSLKDSEVLVLMGHGSSHYSNRIYPLLNTLLREQEVKNIVVGTVEGFPDISYVREFLQRRSRERGEKIDRIILSPLMIVAGNHAINDLAGESELSWKSQLEDMTVQTDCALRGLGELKKIRDLFLEHATEAEKVFL